MIIITLLDYLAHADVTLQGDITVSSTNDRPFLAPTIGYLPEEELQF